MTDLHNVCWKNSNVAFSLKPKSRRMCESSKISPAISEVTQKIL